ncbi:glycosyltransferase [Psychrobium sp. 1_MG-2023]|uniref:glycosyltransferase family 2 protein n=1 Tax=Psychrobium sp. 1_MG-2023 TaxID=3062624 RepID=UPI000C33B7FB|nr:glycosyltransferase [Psychrobium sp. 1_MG-2023]MDP2562111.1 glycosyltransferase [Psychrobium sp. 1_MG-2023]PKF55710.1 glycosyl transferase [Alteromonadales bacterium alter-6D02]
MPEKVFDIKDFRSQSLPTESEIMLNWQGDINQPVVSVLCHTYNQLSYIEDTFRGFLIQKTDFPFEVIVHDDASTDGTSDIVREYTALYPHIFRSVIQTENQYSQGKKPTVLSSAYAKGEYCSLCEGDDFWIEPTKLQRQYNALEQKTNVNLCFTPAYTASGSQVTSKICEHFKEDTLVPFIDIVKGGSGFIPTASIFLRKSILANLPNWFSNAPVGDYYIQMLSGTGGAQYLNFQTCVYRVQSKNSWSSKQNKIKRAAIESFVYGHENAITALKNGDQGEVGVSLDMVLSKYFLIGAYKAIHIKDIQLARHFIKLSWKKKKFLNFRQVILFSLNVCLFNFFLIK